MKKIVVFLIGFFILFASSEAFAQKRYKHSRRQAGKKTESKYRKAGTHSYYHKRKH